MAAWVLAPGGTHPVTKKPIEPLDKAMAPFIEKYPNIDIKWSIIPFEGMWEKMATDVVAGGNDIYWNSAVDFMPGGPLENLDPWMKRDGWDPNEFVPDFSDSGYAHVKDTNDTEAHYYSMPFTFGVVPMIMYDKEIFKHYGVEPLSEFPKPEEVLEKAKKMTGTDPVTGQQTYGYYLPMADCCAQFSWVTMLHAFGGDVWDSNENPTKPTVLSDAGRKTFQWYLDVEKAGASGPDTLTHGGDYPGPPPEFLTDKNQWAITQGCGDVCVSIVSLGKQDKYGGVQFFKDAQGRGGNPGGIGLMMHRATPNKEEAWQLMKWLNGVEMHRFRWVNWAQFSPRKVAQEWPDVKDEPLYEAGYKALATARIMQTYRLARWRPVILPPIQAAVAGTKTAEEALQDMDRDLQAILASPT